MHDLQTEREKNNNCYSDCSLSQYPQLSHSCDFKDVHNLHVHVRVRVHVLIDQAYFEGQIKASLMKFGLPPHVGNCTEPNDLVVPYR